MSTPPVSRSNQGEPHRYGLSKPILNNIKATVNRPLEQTAESIRLNLNLTKHSLKIEKKDKADNAFMKYHP